MATGSIAAGIPLSVIAGVLAIASGVVIWIVYFGYDYFGLADKGKFFVWLGGTVAAAMLFYLAARTYRARQGVDLRLAYAEIPPE